MIRIIFIGLLLVSLGAQASQDAGVNLREPLVSIADQASLQRGAKTFVTQCMTCHSLKYMRYEQMAEGLGLLDSRGKADEKAMKDYGVLPAGAKVTDSIISALTPEAGEATYGIAPPDLSLTARQRGVAWVFTYLHSFYQDPAQASGVNNLLVPGVAMPNILGPLQGTQKPVYHETIEMVDGAERKIQRIQSLELIAPGVLSPRAFDSLTGDLVNFLDYVAEPVKLKRYRLGVWVLLFLSIFVILAYLLKQEYWKDVR